jgi:hypothetical protein
MGAGDARSEKREARGAPRGRPRTFTPEAANATLPYVRVVVKDAMEKWLELQRLRDSLSEESVARDGPRRAEVEAAAERVAEGIGACLKELEEVGAQVKSLEVGLIDFPCEAGGKIVELCWRAGEERITHWHDVGAGYPGRRPLEELPR